LRWFFRKELALFHLFIVPTCIVCCNSPAGMSYVARIEQKEKRTEPQEEALRAPEWQAADQTECHLHLSSPESRYCELTATFRQNPAGFSAPVREKRKNAVYADQFIFGRTSIRLVAFLLKPDLFLIFQFIFCTENRKK
jgi:hypothetical protein